MTSSVYIDLRIACGVFLNDFVLQITVFSQSPGFDRGTMALHKNVPPSEPQTGSLKASSLSSKVKERAPVVDRGTMALHRFRL